MESLFISYVAVSSRLTLLVLLATIALAILVAIAIRRHVDVRKMQDIAGRLEAIDLAAFEILTDSSEDEYLAEHLSSSAHRQVRRARIRAALAYLSAARSNATVLLRYGHEASLSEDASVAQIGSELLSSAMRFQVLCFRNRLRLFVAYLFPATTLRVAGVLDGYARLKTTWYRIGRLQNSAVTGRISASL